MNWMYQGVKGLVDREDYLVGRKIDKTFEMIEQEENPRSSKYRDEDTMERFQQICTTVDDSQPEIVSNSDLSTKMREDPLFKIKMKQLECQKEILKNPLKLKRLKEMLQSSLKEDKHKHERIHSSKVRCKHIRSKRRKNKSKKYSDSDSSTDSSSDSSSASSSSKYVRQSKSKHNKRSASDRKLHKKSKLISSSEKQDRHQHHDRDRTDKSKRKPSSSIVMISKRKPLTEEEIEQKRQEMMDNAEWREKSRHNYVKKLDLEKRKEEEESVNRSNSKPRPNFTKSLLLDMADRVSIADSVQQKRFRSQKRPDSIDSSFSRKKSSTD